MQFRRALHQVLQCIVCADPRQGVVHIFKLDNADGFYRMWIKPEDVPKLGVVLLTEEGQAAFSLALPMGWVESPPYFCAATETIADLENEVLEAGGTGKQGHPCPYSIDADVGVPFRHISLRPTDKLYIHTTYLGLIPNVTSHDRDIDVPTRTFTLRFIVLFRDIDVTVGARGLYP
jgi:hypothetical protein